MSDESDQHDTMPPWAAALEERITKRIEDSHTELKAVLITTIEGMFDANYRVARLESARPRPTEVTGEHATLANGSDGQ